MFDFLKSIGRPGRSFVLLLVSLMVVSARADVSGSISGTIKDPSGNLIPNATIEVREVNTGFKYETHSESNGHFTLPVLPVGKYDLTVAAANFGKYERKDISLSNNAALSFDLALKVGGATESVTVSDYSIHVETTNSQMGEVISARQMAAIPLNGRSFTDLLSMQPGVAPDTAITATTVQDVGLTQLAPSGTLNPGAISVNGQPEGSNIFIVNGSNAENDLGATAAIIPNLDSIAEFRIITNNFDAQYGQYSGGQIHVVTKSGTNNFHGNAFEFFRNTNLDARNYFSPTRGAFEQNQYGGTFGGPIRRDKLFFFADYQGTKQTQGIDTGQVGVPSVTQRAGNFGAGAASLLTGCVSGPYLATLLSQKLGTTVMAGDPYSSISTGCDSNTVVFPTGVIPQSAWSLPAQKLLQYIPAPNNANGTYATSAYNQTVNDNKGAIHIDYSGRKLGLIQVYYFLDQFSLDDPYPIGQSGASVPSPTGPFDARNHGRAQMFTIGDTKILNASMVNELHLNFTRDLADVGDPVGGKNVSLVSQGFVNSAGTSSIVPLDPLGQGVENINFNSYSIGEAANHLTETNNSYGFTDTFTKVFGNHTLKSGGIIYWDQVNTLPIAQFNGTFSFAGTETGSDFADFLIGVPTQYNQSQLNPFYARNWYYGVFAQDSWKARSNLTFNYGLRWDWIAPWTEKYNQISAMVPGLQSTVFPGAPVGLVFPTDPGIPNGLAPTRKLSFSPRFGMVWSPSVTKGVLGKLFGGAGNTSIRTGFGTFYTSIDGQTISILAANPPYGVTYTSPGPPLFANPFIVAASGQTTPQPFPYAFARENSTSRNPNPNINWPLYTPISGIPVYDIHNRVPFTQEYMLSIERQAGRNTILSASYVGTSSHRLAVLLENNPGNPALCLSLSQPNQVAPGSLECGPGLEDSTFVSASGQTYQGTRGPFGPQFGSNAVQSGIGTSTYNALEMLARHTSGPLDFIAAYTFGKSLDESSNIGEEANPFNPKLSHALSSFTVKHNLVLSYQYRLPIDALMGHRNRFTTGWALSGITRLSSGFPVTMVNNGDNSLIGTNPNGVNNSSVDEPDLSGVGLVLNKNPRTAGHVFFNASAFQMNALGTPGNVKRRYFYGPGQIKFDSTLSKTIPLPDSKELFFRIEAFNVFNHTNFSGPTAIDGDIGSATFGQAIGAAPARVMQAVAKFAF